MRVLLITNMFPPHHLGGYELACQDVVERFRERGHHVTVLTTSYQREGVEAERSLPDVRRSLDFYWRDEVPWLPGRRGILSMERHNRRDLSVALRDTAPDVVSLWNMGALPFSLISLLIRTGVPLVYYVANDWLTLNIDHDGLQALLARHPILGRIGAFAAGLPSSVPGIGDSGTFCWVSDFTKTNAEHTTPWSFPRSEVVYIGISHVDFPPVTGPIEPKPWGGRLLYVGRIEGEKNVFTIVDACRCSQT